MPVLSFVVAHGRALLGLTLGALLAVSASSVAAEEIRYRYVSDSFQMRVENVRADPGAPDQFQLFDAVLSAEIFMPMDRPLAAGDDLGDVSRFTMTLNVTGPFSDSETLSYPFVPYCVQCPVMRDMEASLTIGAIGAFALPTDWNLFISRRYILPTGRHDYLELASTDSQERISGFYESFTNTSGELSGGSGVWTLAVVPEPGTSALMVAGIGLLVWLGRRRMSSLDRGLG